jgi:hypothetical protein
MTRNLRRAVRNHWQAWTCLRGWNAMVCIADDLAHMLHLPARRLCDLLDWRLMRRAGKDDDLDAEQVQLAELSTAIDYETWPNTSETNLTYNWKATP